MLKALTRSAAIALVATVAWAQAAAPATIGDTAKGKALVNSKGMTLYTFDADTAGTSTCYDDCAAKWPPYLGKEGDTMKTDWTLVDRTDGTKQWAYDGKPLYFFAGDKAAGDMMGDGMGGKWHIIKE